jgi:hypothetical protein
VTLLDQILAVADELTEPHLHREPYTTWVNRNRKTSYHETVQPGLLAQLYQSVSPVSSNGEAPAGGVPGSRPPLAVEALSRHDEICMAVLRWCTSLRLDTRVSAESNIRGLVGAAGNLDQDTQAVLLAELRQWRRWAAVLTGWENLYRPARVPCPIVDCGKTNTLRINLTAQTALCQACSSTWSGDDGSIAVLADYIRRRTEKVA